MKWLRNNVRSGHQCAQTPPLSTRLIARTNWDKTKNGSYMKSATMPLRKILELELICFLCCYSIVVCNVRGCFAMYSIYIFLTRGTLIVVLFLHVPVLERCRS